MRKDIKFYDRNGILYIKYGKTRKSTKLNYSKASIDYALKNYHLFVGGGITLKKLYDDYAECYKPLKSTSTTIQQKSLFGFILDFFGDVDIRSVSQLKLRTFHAHLMSYVSPYTKQTLGVDRIKSINSLLNCLFDFAVESGVVDINPLPKLKAPQLKQRIARKKNLAEKPLSEEELKKVLNAIKCENTKLAIKLASFTGLRLGELLGLKWSDVDFKKNKLQIKRAKNDLGEIVELKTHSSYRDVLLVTPAQEALKELKSLNDSEEFVINASRRKLRKHFTSALRRSGISKRTVYNTRHTYASMMLSKGVNIAFISRQLGHSDVATTAKYYATYVENKSQEEQILALF